MDLSDKIERLHELTGKPMGQIVVDLVRAHEDEIDPDLLSVEGAQTRIELDVPRALTSPTGGQERETA